MSFWKRSSGNSTGRHDTNGARSGLSCYGAGQTAYASPGWRPADDQVTYRTRPRQIMEDLRAEQQQAASQSMADRARAARGMAGAFRDYYAMLGVDRQASCQEIERAYRRRAAEIHPDKFFNDPLAARQAQNELKALNLGMAVLRDPEQRRRYDAELRLLTPLGSRLRPVVI
jgi:DnaJ-domain-containing protein 1